MVICKNPAVIAWCRFSRKSFTTALLLSEWLFQQAAADLAKQLTTVLIYNSEGRFPTNPFTQRHRFFCFAEIVHSGTCVAHFSLLCGVSQHVVTVRTVLVFVFAPGVESCVRQTAMEGCPRRFVPSLCRKHNTNLWRNFVAEVCWAAFRRLQVQTMSEAEPSSSYPWAEDPLWLCMVTLFLASLATLILYFVQYFQLRSDGAEQRLSTGNAAKEEEEAASLLGWALSLQSWKSKWKGSWCRALNAESKRRGVSLMTNTRSSQVFFRRWLWTPGTPWLWLLRDVNWTKPPR